MSGPPSNQPFSEQIYTYYNQYCASPAVTQQRRVMRNYLLNNHCGSTISNDIKKITNNDISFLLLNADKSEVIQNIVHNFDF